MMNNNLPVIENNSFFGKIKIFFRKIFGINNIKEKENIQQEENHIENISVEERNVDREEFENSIRVSIDIDDKNVFLKDKEREEFIKKLENDPRLFYELTLEKLKKIEEYYMNSIDELQVKLNNLKKAS